MESVLTNSLQVISLGTFKPHDDYLLHFDAARPSEYLYWQEGRWPANVSLVHLYWRARIADTSATRPRQRQVPPGTITTRSRGVRDTTTQAHAPRHPARHTHHAYVDDLWAVSAGAASLQLRRLFGGMFSNLTAKGLDVHSAQRLILAQVGTPSRSPSRRTLTRCAPAWVAALRG